MLCSSVDNRPVRRFLRPTDSLQVAGLVCGALAFVYGRDPGLTILGLNALLFVFYIAGCYLRHSHVGIRYPGFIGRHISSPALHLIDHSAYPRHHDKNMAHMFTFWDCVAGILYLPVRKGDIFFGIGRGEELEYQSVADLYLKPFRKVLAQRARRQAPSVPS